MNSPQRLIVVGAGAKGIALAAKLHALSSADINVPDLILIDPAGYPAANWEGGPTGYTDGRQTLATPALKDVGFPYDSHSWGDDTQKVNSAMLGLSWQACLVAHREFATWVDRGMPHPPLEEWADYLSWVRKETGYRIDPRRVTRIAISNSQWDLTLRDENGKRDHVLGDGPVITGPGRATAIKGYDPDEHPPIITDARNFWLHSDEVMDARPGSVVGVVGSGGAAASVVLALLKRTGDRFFIEVVTPDGVIYSRGESYDEVRHYTDPQFWHSFGSKSRSKFLEHTSAGVFSSEAKATLNNAKNVVTLAGGIREVERLGKIEGVEVVMKGGQRKTYDRLIVASGFDAWWWTRMLDASVVRGLPKTPKGHIDKRAIMSKIDASLALDGLTPRLHLPMLSGIQGPGYFSLMCLGLLSDQILKPYT